MKTARRRTPRPSAQCRRLCSRLSRYVDDDLPEADCQTLERHLKECRCCSDALKGLRRTIDACRKAARTKLPSSVKHRVVERINAILARG